MSSVAVSYSIQFLCLAVALGGAAYGTKASYSKIPNTAIVIGSKGKTRHIRACAILVTLWMVLWLIATVLSAVFLRSDPKAGLNVRLHFSILEALAGSASVSLLFAIQTVLLSVCTTHASIQKLCRFLLIAVLLIFPLGLAQAILSEVLVAGSGSGKDLGHLGIIIASTVITVVLLVIELFTALASLFCLVKYRDFFVQAYYQPLIMINTLSAVRHLFNILPILLFSLRVGTPTSFTTWQIVAVLRIVFTAWTNVACLIIAVNLVSDYHKTVDEGVSLPNETSPLLADD